MSSPSIVPAQSDTAAGGASSSLHTYGGDSDSDSTQTSQAPSSHHAGYSVPPLVINDQMCPDPESSSAFPRTSGNSERPSGFAGLLRLLTTADDHQSPAPSASQPSSHDNAVLEKKLVQTIIETFTEQEHANQEALAELASDLDELKSKFQSLESQLQQAHEENDGLRTRVLTLEEERKDATTLGVGIYKHMWEDKWSTLQAKVDSRTEEEKDKPVWRPVPQIDETEEGEA